ncbi:MAG TPA: hypothetical protein PKY82_30035, partial [Pyrinomonadaceae bacterium]|nr:hypothetical protein [Pyrinomonadaceae bacterium]
MMREAKLIAPENFAIVSLQAPYQHFQPKDNGYRVGFGWLTDYKSEESVTLHHHFLLDVIEKLIKGGVVDKTKIYLYGFSQACALNFRFAFTHPDVMCGVLGVCGGIPGDLDTSKLYQPTNANVFYLYSQTDDFYPLEKFEQFDAKLRDYLPNYQAKSYAAKHEITDEMREDMKNWLFEKNK